MITFRQAQAKDTPLIHNWLTKPHIKQWWDEQRDHPDGGLTRKDLAQFVQGEPSIFIHWIVLKDHSPFAYLMSSDASENPFSYYQPFLEPKGKTLEIDFFIGEEDYLGKGLSYKLLTEFAATLTLDIKALVVAPEARNEPAISVYEKAGFVKVGDYTPEKGPFEGIPHVLMKMRIAR